MFKDAKFTFHKWHSNSAELEDCSATPYGDFTYSKQQHGTVCSENKLLSLRWNKESNTPIVSSIKNS